MPDFQLASQQIVSADEIRSYDEVTDSKAIEDVRPLAQAQLSAALRRAGIDFDALDAADAAKVAGRLHPLAAHVWLAAYWAQLAKDLDADEGFSSKAKHHRQEGEKMARLLLAEPLEVLGISDDRPRGNLRYLGTI